MGVRFVIQIDSSTTFMPSQMFVFGVATFIADSTGHLGHVENYAPGQIIRFGNLEFAADSREELIFLGLASRQILEQHEPLLPDLMADRIQEEHEQVFPDSMPDQIQELKEPILSISMLDRISEQPKEVEIFDPPT